MLEQLEEKVLERISFLNQAEEEDVYRLIDEVLAEEAKREFLSLKQRREYRKRLFYGLKGLDILQELVEDDSITEIMVNGIGHIFLEREGRISCWKKVFLSEERLYAVIQKIVSRVNRVVNEASPIVDARLADGSRVHVVLPPVALDGPILTIRKFGRAPLTMERLVGLGSVSRDAATDLAFWVAAGYNIFISGGTGSGKTTFLNALSSFIPENERIITIEDSAELQIEGIPNLVRLEARNANLEGELAVTIRDLIRAALRMRPDRIVVGEVRDAAALDMLSAMNTGHDGSLSTGHGNSPEDMLRRLETMVLMGCELPVKAIRGQIASALDILIHLERMRDGIRRVTSIVEVTGYEEKTGEIRLHPLYEFEEERRGEGAVRGGLRKREALVHREKLEKSGYLHHSPGGED
ncbi:MAG: CpaF family protein [Lachnospiraceae bacterium]|nr:CpaF family protein [Lachnospiraceae bacterium]